MSHSNDYYEPPPDYSDPETETRSSMIIVHNSKQTQEKGSRCEPRSEMSNFQRHSKSVAMLFDCPGAPVQTKSCGPKTECYSAARRRFQGSELSTSCNTVTFATADDGGEEALVVAPRHCRTLSMKSIFLGEDRNTVDRMKPIINEFRFYQKTNKSILGQKSELQRAIEKRQVRARLRQAHDEKSALETFLEIRALRISSQGIQSSDSTNKSDARSKQEKLLPLPTSQSKTPRSPVDCFTGSLGERDGLSRSSVKIASSIDSHDGYHNLQTAKPSEKVSRVKMILRNIEGIHRNLNHEKVAKSKDPKTERHAVKQLDLAGKSWRASSSSSASSLSPSSSYSSTRGTMYKIHK